MQPQITVICQVPHPQALKVVKMVMAAILVHLGPHMVPHKHAWGIYTVTQPCMQAIALALVHDHRRDHVPVRSRVI